jgi:hypothetical protein
MYPIYLLIAVLVYDFPGTDPRHIHVNLFL